MRGKESRLCATPSLRDSDILTLRFESKEEFEEEGVRSEMEGRIDWEFESRLWGFLASCTCTSGIFDERDRKKANGATLWGIFSMALAEC